MHLLLRDKIDVRSAGKYSEPVFDLMRIIPVDARGYAGTRELSAAIGIAGRFGASAEKARGPASHSKESGGPDLSVWKTTQLYRVSTSSKEAALKNLSYCSVVF